jgi:hypothetical protein
MLLVLSCECIRENPMDNFIRSWNEDKKADDEYKPATEFLPPDQDFAILLQTYMGAVHFFVGEKSRYYTRFVVFPVGDMVCSYSSYESMGIAISGLRYRRYTGSIQISN